MQERVNREPKWMTDFLAAVYPEMTDLAVGIAHTEKQILSDATAAILDARKERDEARKALLWSVGRAYGMYEAMPDEYQVAVVAARAAEEER
jgi:hypothetical protein